MRCAYPVTYYAFASPTGTQRVVVETYQYGEEVDQCLDSEYVLMTYSQAASLNMNPFYMDITAALQIGGAIWLVMAVAYGFRMIRNFLLSSKGVHDD